MRKRAVVIGTSNHLPEGSPQSLFEETYQQCWRPWLSTLYRFPDILSTVHYSGTVLAWLQSHHPEFIMLLEEMTSRKQVEILGGGYFAPIMPIIPPSDRVGQLELHSTLIRKLLGRRPRGAWIREFAWEPSLVSTYNACGLDFTFLPVSIFELNGLSPATPVMTEDQGRSICVIPVMDLPIESTELSDPALLFSSYFEKHEEAEIGVLMFQDEILISAWRSGNFESPDVFFETMFATLLREGASSETVLPARWLKASRALGRGYFSCAASARLAEASGDSLVAGSSTGQLFASRRLLLRHPESHSLYAKMHFVRILVGQLRGDKARKKSAQEEVWRAQCGDAYYEGPRGGILSLPVRSAAWSALIGAEKTARHKGSFVPGIIRADIDLDGQKEILFQGVNYNAHVRLGEATLAEFDSFRSLTNYVNALDGQRRSDPLECFVDRLCRRGSFSPRGAGRGSSVYSLLDGGRPSMTASFEGTVRECEAVERSLSVGKIYSFRRDNMGLTWTISNPGDSELSCRFVTELNMSAGCSELDVTLRAGGEPHIAGSAADGRALSSFAIENAANRERLDFRSDHAFDLLFEPLVTDSSDGAEAGTSWQGMRILLGWDLELAPGAIDSFSLTLELSDM